MVENRVRAYRERLHWTQVQLAEHAGVSTRTLSDIEHGAEPRVLTAIRIARALGVRVEQLWTDV